MSERIIAKKGLEGIVADSSSISKAIPEEAKLVYYGYPVHDLAEHCSFEEVAYLLWNGELPTSNELAEFCAREKSERSLDEEMLSLLRLCPKDAHPMDMLRTAVSFIGMKDDRWRENSVEAMFSCAFNLLAKLPLIVANIQRIKQGKSLSTPDNDLSISENFFKMCFGEVPDQKIVSAFDKSLILYAEHGFNASTFTARVVTSSISDLYSAVTAAIGSLKGPLHGGANEAVMHMLKDLESPEQAEAWLRQALKEKKKVMGFGHRLYNKGDSRVPTMKMYRNQVAEICDQQKWVEISNALEQTMIAEKNIHPNLDFPAGPTYFMMGFEIEVFTPIFVMSRVSGWSAHIIEQMQSNRLIRPLSEYTGPETRAVRPLEQR